MVNFSHHKALFLFAHNYFLHVLFDILSVYKSNDTKTVLHLSRDLSVNCSIYRSIVWLYYLKKLFQIAVGLKYQQVSVVTYT